MIKFFVQAELVISVMGIVNCAASLGGFEGECLRKLNLFPTTTSKNCPATAHYKRLTTELVSGNLNYTEWEDEAKKFNGIAAKFLSMKMRI